MRDILQTSRWYLQRMPNWCQVKLPQPRPRATARVPSPHPHRPRPYKDFAGECEKYCKPASEGTCARARARGCPIGVKLSCHSPTPGRPQGSHPLILTAHALTKTRNSSCDTLFNQKCHSPKVYTSRAVEHSAGVRYVKRHPRGMPLHFWVK